MTWPIDKNETGGWEPAPIDETVAFPKLYRLPVPHRASWFEPAQLGGVGVALESEVDVFGTGASASVRHVGATVEASIELTHVYGAALIDAFAYAVGGFPCSCLLELYADNRQTVIWSVSTAPDHARPYLLEPSSYGEQEVDFATGAATIGTVTVTIIDKTRTPGDQDAGWMTDKLAEIGAAAIHGRRARLRRFISEEIGYVTIADGPASNVSMDASYAAFTFAIRDTREGERKIRGFYAGGSRALLPPGAGLEGYGYRYETDSFLVEPPDFITATFVRGGEQPFSQGSIDPAMGGYVDFGGADEEQYRISDEDWALIRAFSGITSTFPLLNIPWTNATVPASVKIADGPPEVWLVDKSTVGPVPSNPDDRLAIRWREAGTGDPWIELDATLGLRALVDPPWPGSNPYPIYYMTREDGFARRLWFGDTSDFPAIPDDGMEIEFQLFIRGPANNDHPVYVEWETFDPEAPGIGATRMTAGEFIKQVYDGYFSPRDENGELVPSDVRYDPVALALMTDPVRIRITGPVDDMRDWLEKNVYAPLGWAPALDSQGRVSPIYGGPPSDTSGLQAITNLITEPAPDWDSGQKIINVVKFTYPRDFVPEDEEDAESGDGLATRDVVLEFTNPVSVERHGRKVIEMSGQAFRSLGQPDGSPFPVNLVFVPEEQPDPLQNEQGWQLADGRRVMLLDRFALGAPAFRVNVRRTFLPLLRAGDFVVVDLSWLPDYVTGKRGLLTLGQVIAIADLDCAWRSVLIEQVPPAEATS